MINHHPQPDLLYDYAAGTLPEGLALAVATHLALCPDCALQVHRMERLGGALLDEVAPEEVSDHLLDAVMARLDEPVPVAPRASLDRDTLAVVPSPLRRYLGRSLGDLPWRSVGRMFQEFRLPLSSSGMKASLMRLRPGILMPQHTHRGNEYTMVLAGGYQDAGKAFGPGDFDAKDRADKHQPVVDADGECICLVVLDAPVKLTGTVGLLVNPFLRI
jgi:putative transcriptional regulator